MASGSEIRMTDVPFVETPETTALVFINNGGKLRQTDLSTMVKYSNMYGQLSDLVTESTNNINGLISECTLNLNNFVSTSTSDINTLIDTRVQEIEAASARGHEQLLEDLQVVSDIITDTQEIHRNLDALDYQAFLDRFGIMNKTTTFNADGSITELSTDGECSRITTFDGNIITETVSSPNHRFVKTTTFNEDGSITEAYTVTEL